MSSCGYLIRHAHADWHPDEMRPLSQRGKADAIRLADRIVDNDIAAIYSSPATRARQTVEPLALRLKLEVMELPDLRERSLGRFDLERVDHFEAKIEATWREFDFAHPDGESNAQAQQRIVRLYQTLRQRHRRAAVVLATHGSLLALLLNYHDPKFGLKAWLAMTMPDAYRLAETGITRIWPPLKL